MGIEIYGAIKKLSTDENDLTEQHDFGILYRSIKGFLGEFCSNNLKFSGEISTTARIPLHGLIEVQLTNLGDFQESIDKLLEIYICNGSGYYFEAEEKEKFFSDLQKLEVYGLKAFSLVLRKQIIERIASLFLDGEVYGQEAKSANDYAKKLEDHVAQKANKIKEKWPFLTAAEAEFFSGYGNAVCCYREELELLDSFWERQKALIQYSLQGYRQIYEAIKDWYMEYENHKDILKILLARLFDPDSANDVHSIEELMQSGVGKNIILLILSKNPGNFKSTDNESLVFWALDTNTKGIRENLPSISFTINAASPSPFARKAFFKAVNEGKAHIIEFIFMKEKGPHSKISLHLSKDEEGDTALHIAARHVSDEHLKVLELLIQRGADVNSTNGDGLTALDLALKKNVASQAVRLLAIAGGTVTSLKDITPDRGFYLSSLGMNYALTETLLNNGYLPNYPDMKKNTALHHLAFSVRGVDDNKYEQFFSILQLLLENKASINAKNDDDQDFIDLVLNISRAEWKKGIAYALLEEYFEVLIENVPPHKICALINCLENNEDSVELFAKIVEENERLEGEVKELILSRLGDDIGDLSIAQLKP